MPIVTDGLIGYWNSKQGVSGSTWDNIAPSTVGSYNGTITGAVLQADGMYFDGVDDKVEVKGIAIGNTSISTEIIFQKEEPISQRTLLALYKDTNTRKSVFYNGDNYYSYGNGLTDTGDSMNFNQSGVPLNTYQTITTVFDSSTGTKKIYYNGVLKTDVSKAVDFKTVFDLYMGVNFYNNAYTYYQKGKIASIKVYGKALTDAEITQNYAVGTEVGLTSPPPSLTVAISSTSKTKISDEPNADRSNITFKFNQDVQAYTVNVGGTSYNTGIVAHSGGSVVANTDIVAEVDWTELQQEGANRVNIYGQGLDGVWMNYES